VTAKAFLCNFGHVSRYERTIQRKSAFLTRILTWVYTTALEPS